MTAPFLGVIDLNLRTFTTTYTPWSGGGWSWLSNSLMPIDFGSNLPSSTIGFGATVFDFATGATKYAYGNVSSITGAANANGICFLRNLGNTARLAGWLVGPSALAPFEFSDNIVLGTPKTVGFTPTASFVLPNVANTAFPEPFVGANYVDTNSKIMGGYRINLSPFSAFLDPLSQAVTSGFPFTMPIGTNSEVQFSIPYKGLNYLFMRDATGGTPTATIYISPDMIGLSSSFIPTLVNPPGSSIDLNAYITAVATGSPNGTYNGYLWMNKNALTITGRTFNGFGILMLPDGSGYYLLNFIPADAGAVNWNGGISNVNGKFDDTGVLWLQTPSSPGTVWSTTPIPKYAYPLYPPIGVPSPPNDSNIQIRLYRGQSQ